MIQRRILTPDKALARAEQLCVRAEHSSGEIRAKLRQWGVGEADASRIMESLLSRRFVDDVRFTEAFVRDKVAFARWGRRKIAMALVQKGISRSIADAALGAVDFDRYEDGLRHILIQKKRTLPEADSFEGRTRLFRFAASRGFEPELIARIIREI